MGGESEDQEPDDARAAQVAEARDHLEAERRDGSIGSIARAQAVLAAAYALAGQHEDSVSEYDALLDYLSIANAEGSQEHQRWTRIMSPSAPRPGPDDIDLNLLATVAVIHKAESLILLGRREQARAALDLAEQGCRGLTKRGIRRHVRALRQRLEDARQPVAADTGSSQPDLTAEEQVAAADDLLGEGRHDEAALVALSAIARSDSVSTRARARHVLGMALEEAGRTADAIPVLDAAFDDYLTSGQPQQAAELAGSLAWKLTDIGKREGAVATMRKAVQAARAAADQRLRARLLVDLGSMLDSHGEQDPAMRSFDDALSVAEGLPDAELAANARHGVAVLLANHRGADPEQAVEALSLLDRCRAEYLQAGVEDRAAGCDHEAAALLGRLGSFEAAKARYVRALDTYQNMPNQPDLSDAKDDCHRNLAALRHLPEAPDISPAQELFLSGGHSMRHGAAAT
ncbi:MAG: hypothetical protein U0990_01200 [Candidatus Nanopelagicales bacterium]|nr:hypothetical protein [Candidatus Nanopelagicales bacterium]MDZ4248690.1 hypothetical protein [Candidatus Nanopelagicales bacterium]